MSRECQEVAVNQGVPTAGRRCGGWSLAATVVGFTL